MCACMRSESESELGHQLSGILNKTHKHAYLCVCVCICLWGARANQRHTRHYRSSRSDLYMCARARVCWHYFANLSTVSVRLPVHTVTQKKHTRTHTSHTKNTGKYRSSHDRKSALSLKHIISVLSHEEHAHSLKRWKPGKNVRWQGRQLVVVQIKRPVSRGNRELGHQL
jgi:hypothetical protein